MNHPDNLIEVERRCYLESGNAMHVWAAYAFARAVDAPLPDWVMSYLDRCGRNLMALSSEVRSTSGKDLGPRIAKAFGLASPGSGSPLTTYHHDWMSLGMSVRDRITRRDDRGRADQETYAIEQVADEAGLAPSTVRRAYKLFDHIFPGTAVFPDDAVKE
jgi:hypothetical protein